MGDNVIGILDHETWLSSMSAGGQCGLGARKQGFPGYIQMLLHLSKRDLGTKEMRKGLGARRRRRTEISNAVPLSIAGDEQADHGNEGLDYNKRGPLFVLV